jgi:hypothetical protein
MVLQCYRKPSAFSHGAENCHHITFSYDLLGLLKLAELEGQAGSRD